MQAIGNPEEIRLFARQLKEFNAQLQGNMKRLNAQFGRLGNTWRDKEHQKFAREYQQTMRVLNQFQRTSDEQIPFLLRKAEALDRYLKQR